MVSLCVVKANVAQRQAITPKDEEYAKSWLTMADHLGIEVVAPFELVSNGHKYVYAFCIRSFGNEKCKNGIVGRVEGDSFSPEQCGEIWDVAVENGYSPHNQAIGAITLSIDDAKQTLNAYRWYGQPAKKPSWHTEEFYDELWS